MSDSPNLSNNDNFVNPQQSTFRRSLKDKKNPYAQINRDLLHDRSISPKAKGIISYLLSLPDDWQIYHSHLMYALNIGEDYLNSGIDELIKAGYVKRERKRFKGIYQPYTYEISEFKIFQPNGENQPGSSSPENPDIQKKEAKPIKDQQQPAAPVAVFPCVKPLEIPEDEKIWLCKNYPEEQILRALDFCSKEPPKESFIQQLKWACKKQPEPKKMAKESSASNKKFAQEMAGTLKQTPAQKKRWTLEVLHKHVEIVYHGSQKQPFSLAYDEAGFKQKLADELKLLQP